MIARQGLKLPQHPVNVVGHTLHAPKNTLSRLLYVRRAASPQRGNDPAYEGRKPVKRIMNNGGVLAPPAEKAMKACLFMLALGAAVTAANGASAHHSFSMYDRHKTVTLSGTVKEYIW